MKGTVTKGLLDTDATKLLIIFSYEDEPSAEYKMAEALLATELNELKKSKEFTGQKLQACFLRTPTKPFEKLLLVGLGKKEEFSIETLRRAAGTAVKVAREFSDEITVPFLDSGETQGLAHAVQAITEGFIMGHYRFLKYKTQGLDDLKVCKRFTILVESQKQVVPAKKGLGKGTILATAACYTRDLVNTPAMDCHPASLETEAKSLAKKHKLRLTVFNQAELKKRKMNAIIAVGQGSAIKPRMLILNYKKPGAKKKLIFCGKGVTFDSGGYNIKTRMMELMKDDMGGAAALLGMLDAVASLKLKADVTVIIGAVENLISGDAYKPGDVVTAMNGKTIEVNNTDAEGRIVLADCLSYASTLKADRIIDIATLTGAAMVALGPNAAAICTPNDEIADDLIEAGELSGDRAWRIPMWDDYKEDIKSDIADVKNLGRSFYAGVTAGATLLQEFVKEPKKWAHIDIGAAVHEDRERPYLPKGATGWGVRILTTLVEEY
jgi:leucyl aminopeptidase